MHVISSVLLQGAPCLWSGYSEWTLPEQSLCNKQDWYDSLKACWFMNASSSVWVPGSGCYLLDEWKLRFPLSCVCVCVCEQKTSHFLCGSQVLPPIFLFDFKHFSPCVTGMSASQTWKHEYTWRSEELMQHRTQEPWNESSSFPPIGTLQRKTGISGLFWAKSSPTINISAPAWSVKRPWRKC